VNAPRADSRRVTIHLTGQPTVEFRADHLWPSSGEYARFGVDLSAFAEEVSRRLRTDGYVGCRLSADRITIIPLSAVMRIDFVDLP
jgi:hypothetical protein